MLTRLCFSFSRVSSPSVVRALPVWNMVVCAVLQYEHSRESGSNPGHCAPAVLRLEDYHDHVGHRLCRLLVCMFGVCKERAKGCWPAQHRGSSQEGGQGRQVKKMVTSKHVIHMVPSQLQFGCSIPAGGLSQHSCMMKFWLVHQYRATCSDCSVYQNSPGHT